MRRFELATHKSAKKRHKQSLEAWERNRAIKSKVKTHTRKVLVAVEARDPEEAKKALAEAVPVIDKAASKGALKKTTASRKVSRLSKKVHGIVNPPSS